MKKRIAKSVLKPGRWVRVMYDDIGARDGILIGKSQDWFEVFFPFDNTDKVDYSQIIGVGAFIEAKNAAIA